MARRSPGNPRYQKHTAPSGKTRRSASSARIKRTEAPAKKPEKPRLGLVPQTPEMKKWRRIWWALLGVALAFASVALIPGLRENRTLTGIALAAEFAALAAAIYIDWKVIRPLRQQAVEQAKKERKGKG